MPLREGFTGRYCRYCRPERGNDFTRTVLRLPGTIAYIADQRAQGARWRDIAIALQYPRPLERFAAYVLGTSEWSEWVSYGDAGPLWSRAIEDGIEKA